MMDLKDVSLLLRPLPLLVTSLLFSGVFCSSSGASSVCDIPCCSVLPSCGNARYVICDCPDMDAITLRKGDIPETVRDVIILNTREVIIDENLLSSLNFLKAFTISSIDKVEIKENGMASQEDSELSSVTIENIKTLQVETKAFSGVWHPKTNIRMRHIGKLNVDSNALDYQVVELGPTVSLQDVEMLDLKPNGFASSIFELSLENVTMIECHKRSFGGKTLSTKLKNVTIGEAKASCFFGVNSITSFNIQSLRTQTVYHSGFSGVMDELTIKQSQFISIQRNGFNIQAEKMHVSESKINRLHDNGLSVLADVITLKSLKIDHLQKNALAGVQISSGSANVKKHLLLSHLYIIKADDESLALSESVNQKNLEMKHIHVVSRKTIVCPTRDWVRILTGANPNEPIIPAQYALSTSLTGTVRCEEAHPVVNKVPVPEPIDENAKERCAKDNIAPDDNDNTLSAVKKSAPASGGVQPVHHHWMLCMALGVVLATVTIC